MTAGIFQKFDFSLLDSADFKEDSVREDIIAPLLLSLGYTTGGLNRILRSKRLEHPFVSVGSRKRKISIIPDYLLSVENKFAWVLDAKSPREEIKSGENVEQTYSYAIHPEIKVRIHALCNGREFIAFRTDEANPVLYFHLSEISRHWQRLYDLLSPSAFKIRRAETDEAHLSKKTGFDYAEVKPLQEISALRKQAAKRHFGVHPYFTKQVWHVVQEYIKNFCHPGGVVLDPYGGSGVTLVEALLLGRKAVHIDINPLSVFLVSNLISPVHLEQLYDEFRLIKKKFDRHAPQTEEEIEAALEKYPYPKGVVLPKNSDVKTVEQLFSKKQLAQLAFLKYLIGEVQNEEMRHALLLSFSSSLNKFNLTFHYTKSSGGGDSGVFRYYRYRIAPEPGNLDLMPIFQTKFKKLMAAKQEISPFIHAESIQNAQIYKGTATNLDKIADESIDYIYTDPPYGKKIQYLDLSVMWNAWLDLPVYPKDYELEAIEGGELNKSKADYSDLLAQSIEEMYRVLKFDRWMSFVFAHKDPAYWHLIVETAEKAGFEYMGAVRQSNDKVTFKKRQNPFTVLSGQLIVNFKKVKSPKAIMKSELGADVSSIVIETVENMIAQNHGATLEEINNELIIKGLEFGFLDILSKEYQDITPFLKSRFTYNEKTRKFHLPENRTFKSCIDLHLRIKYFLISYLRRMKEKGYHPTFDDIVLNIMPLLKNGITPEEQTILNILEKVAIRTGEARWQITDDKQMTIW